MVTTVDLVDYYISKARSGDLGKAFHGLRELDHNALPAMQSAYRCENDPIVRSLIVEAIWQHRQVSVIDFLADVLQDPAPEVWKQALDGLVTLASQEAKFVLQRAEAMEDDEERRAWFGEAIEQVCAALSDRA